MLLIVDYARQRSINSHGVTWPADLALGPGCVCGNSHRSLLLVADAEYFGHLSIVVEEITEYSEKTFITEMYIHDVEPNDIKINILVFGVVMVAHCYRFRLASGR